MTELHTIGEMSRLTGLSEKALRLYDERGLLPPAEVDPGSGYRRYSGEQVETGRTIAMLRAIEMPLAEIGALLGLPADARSEAVGRYWYAVERELDDLRETVRELRQVAQREAAGTSLADTVAEQGRNDGPLGAVATLSAISDPIEAAPEYTAAMRAAYWDDRDLPRAVAIALAGAGRLLADAHAAGDGATVLRSAAKTLLYDLASFTWPGWAEPGIEVTAVAAEIGLSAARANLALAVELEKAALARSRAHWILGAHLLSAGSSGAAASEFTTAATWADEAGSRPEALLAGAFAELSALSAGDAAAGERLDARLTELRSQEGGADLAAQVTTARAALAIF